MNVQDNNQENGSTGSIRPDSPDENLLNEIWNLGHVRVSRMTWSRNCRHCDVKLLTGEEAGFCCGKGGKHLRGVPRLPPQSAELIWLSSQPGVSQASRKLNVLFSFAAMETTGTFNRARGPESFVAIQGKVYHRLRPDKAGTGLRWVLYDGYDGNSIPHEGYGYSEAWINAIRVALTRDNPFAREFLILRNELSEADCPNHFIALSGNGAVGEIAAIIRYDSTAVASVDPRTLVICVGQEQKVKIPTISRLWEPLAYPLLFDKGTLGWGVINDAQNLQMSADVDDSVVQSTQIWYYRIRLLREERFHRFGRLANEYLVDMWTREIETRLYYAKMNQERRLQQDLELMGESGSESSPRENIYLPANFSGSVKWASENVSDALALAARFGSPTFFITVTCNPEWPEITSMLYPGQGFSDQPMVVSRVFKQKLSNIMEAISKMFPNAGNVLYKMHVIEFQKRGLPHAHILIKFEKECILPSDIDKVISTEMPADESDAALVRKFMMHHHNDPVDGVRQSCQRLTSSGRYKCRFAFPHALQEFTTVDFEGRVHYRRRRAGDQWVVAHCLELLRKFNCHINFEAANTSHIFSYLFKYVHKGPDRTGFSIQEEDDAIFDEYKLYWTGRYLSAGEAAWRILGFHITRKDPGVTSLPVHLASSNVHHQYYRRSGNMSTLSSLDHYFLRPSGIFTDRQGVIRLFSELRYEEYFTLFRLIKYDVALLNRDGHFEEKPRPGQIRQMCFLRFTSHPHVVRLQSIRPSEGEVFYLRSILSIRPGEDFEDLKKFNGISYSSYQEVAHAMGIFSEEQECVQAFQEAIALLKTPAQLRFLFVHMLVNECIETPLDFWNRFKGDLSYDFFLRARGDAVVAETRCLESINRFLEEYGRDLTDFGISSIRPSEGEVYHELARYSAFLQELADEAAEARSLMTQEQLRLFEDVIRAVNVEIPLSLFLDGKAGTGKTHVIRAICSHLRSRQKIVIATATSAFAAQLYDGGRTAHSAFKVPVNSLNQMLESEIKPNSQRANLIRLASLIIWDEAPMANKAVLECVDAVLRKIMGNDMPFGGKVVILSGDFRQTCPVIPRGQREDIIEASIRSSYLWPAFTIYKLTIPIRQAEDVELQRYLDDVGAGVSEVVPVAYLESCYSPRGLIDFVFPQDILRNSLQCVKRSILCPTNRQVDFYNNELLKRLEGESRVYLSADYIKEATETGIIAPSGYVDFHREHTPPGLPPHKLQVKVNGVYRLMRNISVDRGLVKNSRVVIKSLGVSVVCVQLITRNGPIDEDIILPRINFTYEIPGSGFTLCRRQFPLAPAYATTFNSCQGLTLDKVGIDLTSPVFSHGQLYTALSRIRRRQDGMIRLRNNTVDTIENVTFRELLIQ